MNEIEKLLECLKEAGYSESRSLTKDELDEIAKKTKEIAKEKGYE